MKAETPKVSVPWLIASCFFFLVRATLENIAQCTEGNTWEIFVIFKKITCTGLADLSTGSLVQSSMSFLLEVGELVPRPPAISILFRSVYFLLRRFMAFFSVCGEGAALNILHSSLGSY